MSAMTRDITISVHGVPLVVTVLTASPTHPTQEPRRWHVRIAGSKHDIDELLSSGVLSAIDRRIKGGLEPMEEGEVFEVPTHDSEALR